MPVLTEAPVDPEPPTQSGVGRGKRPWRPRLLTVSSAIIALFGLTVLLYPTTASWFSSYNQSLLIKDYSQELVEVVPSVADQLHDAYAYNDALSAGVRLDANANVPTGDGVSSDTSLDYNNILSVNGDGLMARVRIPSIDADLPIYHGTSDEVLLKGAGHLEGSHLPVGGHDSHSVITAHRGLANATMFSNLDGVKVGDTFTIEVFREVLTYQVTEKKVVEPDDTDTLRVVAGKDLVTLVTCTPLGINSHRILVTGERITPTPIKDLESMGAEPTIPGFPWWAVIYGGILIGVTGFVWRAGYADAALKAQKLASADAAAVPLNS